MRILLVRLREIGDVVFTTPAITALRHRYPQASLSYLVEPPAAPVVEGNPHLNEIIVAPPRAPGGPARRAGRRGPAGRLTAELRLVRDLRRRRFDLAIDFHGGPRASILTWLSGAPRRVGYQVSGRSWMYTTAVPRSRALRARHSVENQWDLLLALGIEPPDPTRHPVAMAVTATAAADVARRLAAAGVTDGERVIVMHVSAGNPFRRWPIPAFAAVASQLAGEDPRHRIIFTSGPTERAAVEQVMGLARQHLDPAAAARIVACGDFSLAELRALVARAALYIGGDSGPLHIAATSHVPVVGLFGPTLPARSTPWRAPHWPTEALEVTDLPCRPCEQRACVPGDFRCLTRITPQAVVAAAHRLLRAGCQEAAG